MGPRKMAYQYKPVPRDQDESFVELDLEFPKRRSFFQAHRLVLVTAGLGTIILASLGFVFLRTLSSGGSRGASCDKVGDGYQCQPEISHYWGQYAPYYSVPSEISPDIPKNCEITFAQVLSRHGARDPTLSKTALYAAVVAKIQSNTKSYSNSHSFLKGYNYTLGADQLTTFGEQQMVNSGIKFYNRYEVLAREFSTFVRASGQDRVIHSGEKFTQGYHQARLRDKKAIGEEPYPYPITVISEEKGSNNTMNHGLCTAFERSNTGDAAQLTWQAIFAPPITAHLNKNLPGADLNDSDAISVMDLCPFNTVASATGEISPFCDLFTETQWHQYDYYQSLGKYYGYGNGNFLGPTQGVGYVNELIARLTGKPVRDDTTVNHTLDDSHEAFPIGPSYVLYADFSHDNDMSTIYAALGLYNSTPPLSNTTMQGIADAKGYSAGLVVPFAARAYFEKMECHGSDEESVRVLINDRVLPLETCGGDSLGRCKLSKFVESLNFARSGGEWDKCFM